MIVKPVHEECVRRIAGRLAEHSRDRDKAENYVQADTNKDNINMYRIAVPESSRVFVEKLAAE